MFHTFPSLFQLYRIFHFFLTLNLLTTTIVAPPSNASKWQMGFTSAFKGLIYIFLGGGGGCAVDRCLPLSFPSPVINIPVIYSRDIRFEFRNFRFTFS